MSYKGHDKQQNARYVVPSRTRILTLRPLPSTKNLARESVTVDKLNLLLDLPSLFLKVRFRIHKLHIKFSEQSWDDLSKYKPYTASRYDFALHTLDVSIQLMSAHYCQSRGLSVHVCPLTASQANPRTRTKSEKVFICMLSFNQQSLQFLFLISTYASQDFPHGTIVQG